MLRRAYLSDGFFNTRERRTTNLLMLAVYPELRLHAAARIVDSGKMGGFQRLVCFRLPARCRGLGGR